MCPNWDFWFENKPSGSHASDQPRPVRCKKLVGWHCWHSSPMTKWTFSALILALPPFAEFQYVELQMSK
jgi:hypothetical protein